MSVNITRVASRTALGDTRTRKAVDKQGSDLHGISVQDLTSCQVIFSLRRITFFFHSDVKRESLMHPFKS